MRVFNALDAQISIPFVDDQRLNIASHSASGNFVGNIDFIKRLVSCYGADEVGIIVSGPYELSMCSEVPVACNYIYESLDNAISKLCVKKEEPKVLDNQVVDSEEDNKEAEPIVESNLEDKEAEVKDENEAGAVIIEDAPKKKTVTIRKKKN